MNIISYKNISPKISEKVFIAPNAYVIGDVEIGEESGIFFNCIIRGDVNHIRIGRNTNIQDNSTIHVTRKTAPTIIGSYVTIGHKALLHGCNINDYGFVGMGAVIMDFAVVESFSMVAAGAVLTPRKIVKSGEIWAGNPAKFFRLMTEEEKLYIKISADNYSKHAEEYREIFR